MTRLRSILFGLAIAAPLAFGAWTALPDSADSGLRCTLPGPCSNDCFGDCVMAGYPDGGECNEFDDCCLCFE